MHCLPHSFGTRLGDEFTSMPHRLLPLTHCGAVSVYSDVGNEGGIGITEKFSADYPNSLFLCLWDGKVK